jgi:hypothetical protein
MGGSNKATGLNPSAFDNWTPPALSNTGLSGQGLANTGLSNQMLQGRPATTSGIGGWGQGISDWFSGAGQGISNVFNNSQLGPGGALSWSGAQDVISNQMAGIPLSYDYNKSFTYDNQQLQNYQMPWWANQGALNPFQNLSNWFTK